MGDETTTAASQLRICVFCASASGLPAHYEAAAEALGRAIGERGHALVFGGFETGLMGTVARAAKAAGAQVTGVLPCRLGELPDRPVFASDELVETANIAERKVRMEQLADAFAVLPGSFGTLDELYDVLAAEKLMGTRRPVAALDVDGLYAPLVELHRRMVAVGLMSEQTAALLRMCGDVDELLAYLEGARA